MNTQYIGVDVCINLAAPSSTIGTDHWQARGRPFMALKMIKFSHYRSNCAKDKPQNGSKGKEKTQSQNPSAKGVGICPFHP